MAVGSQQYTVATGPTLIASAPGDALPGGTPSPSAWVTVNNTGATAYLGGSNVSASNGMPMLTATTQSFALFPGDQLYAFCATSSVVSVLQT